MDMSSYRFVAIGSKGIDCGVQHVAGDDRGNEWWSTPGREASAH